MNQGFQHWGLFFVFLGFFFSFSEIQINLSICIIFQANFVLWQEWTSTKFEQCFASVLFLGSRPVAQNFIGTLSGFRWERVHFLSSS